MRNKSEQRMAYWEIIMVFLTKLREEKLMERGRLESRRGRGH